MAKRTTRQHEAREVGKTEKRLAMAHNVAPSTTSKSPSPPPVGSAPVTASATARKVPRRP